MFSHGASKREEPAGHWLAWLKIIMCNYKHHPSAAANCTDVPVQEKRAALKFVDVLIYTLSCYGAFLWATGIRCSYAMHCICCITCNKENITQHDKPTDTNKYIKVLSECIHQWKNYNHVKWACVGGKIKHKNCYSHAVAYSQRPLSGYNTKSSKLVMLQNPDCTAHRVMKCKMHLNTKMYMY